MLIAVFLHKSHTWGKSGSWDMAQNAFSQSDCRIFKLAISLEQIDEKAWFFACWYRFKEIKIGWEILWQALSKVGVATLVSGLWLYPKKELMEQTSFWCVNKNKEKPKVTLIIFGWCWSKRGVAFLVLGL